jgi:hypothetical protein
VQEELAHNGLMEIIMLEVEVEDYTPVELLVEQEDPVVGVQVQH